MTDTEKSQLRQDLMEQFSQMMAEQLPTGAQEYESQPMEWAPTR